MRSSRNFKTMQIEDDMLHLSARLSQNMARRPVGEAIYRHTFLSKGFVEVSLIFIALICISRPTTSYAQEGFLSIDCGYAGADYIDHNTNLTWTADSGNYMNVGETYEQPALNPSDGGSQALQRFRSFPEPRNKYCYELPTVNDSSSYLIRASFYLNETELKQRRPFQFVLSLDANNWFTLTSGGDSLSNLFAAEEAIFYPTNNITNFCLQPVIGAPFISSLELRFLDDAMYNYTNSRMEYLTLLFRYNLGATNSTPSVRFPDDKFDRIWGTPRWSNPNYQTDERMTTISKPTPPDNKARADANYVPVKVMQDGWLMNYTSDNYLLYAPVFTLYSEYVPVYMTPAEYLFPAIYVENLSNTDSNRYRVNVSVDNYITPDVNFSNQANMVPNQQYRRLTSNSIQLSVQSDLGLDEGPTINAVEVYAQNDYNFSLTDPTDVDAIKALKISLNLSDWTGDPCTPVPHDGLSCRIETVTNIIKFTDYQPIEKPCGLNGTLIEYCEEEQGLHSLSSTFSVTTLNLQNISALSFNLFTSASANTSDIWLNNLFEMSITYSKVDNGTLQLILENFLKYLYNFVTLDMSYNAIGDIESIDWSTVPHLTSLNLSHSQVSGVVSAFDYAPLQTLDLSYNNLSSLPTIWNSTSIWNSTVSNLGFLDLSHNQLQGPISSLDQLVQTNNGSLQELYISNNSLDGTFSSSVYFSGLPNLEIANFDDNHIQGTLDLTMCHEALQQAKNSSTQNVTRQLFSFVNNNIAYILPDAETIKSTMDMLNMKPQYGILLGGNPFCTNAKQYAQRYLCRYTTDQPIPNDKSQTILIVSICGGVAAILLSIVTSATLWRLWKQVYSLRAIQQALAQRKVQPPFYQYSDLKIATRDFHKDNKLGHGGFGIVYKGVLEDGTKLAVKKLFGSKGSQARDDLDEFLNEVVLITGIKHRNLVQLKGCCINDKQRMLVYEFAEKGNLAEALWGSMTHGSVNWAQRFNICVGVSRGLSYLHEELQPSIIHRDIKPENILLDHNYKPKIADFGLARHSSHEANETYTANIAGTLGYFSPEYASEGQLSDKADVYSYGIVVLEIISGRKCINHSLPLEQVYLKDWVRKMHKKGMLLDVLQSELRDNCVVDEVIRAIKIGLLCVQNSPRNRPSMSQVVTMLLGSADVKVVLDESDDSRHYLKDILESIDKSAEFPVFETPVTYESSDAFPFLDVNAESSSNYIDSKSSVRPSIELGVLQGR